MLKAKIFLIETSLSMSKGFLDHNLFHDPNVTTIHRDYPDNRAKDVRISILWPALIVGTAVSTNLLGTNLAIAVDSTTLA